MKLATVLFALTFAASGATQAQPVSKPKPAADAKPARPIPPRPLGPELWHGARTGMAQEDVAAMFPAAKPSGGELLPGGSKSALTLPVQLGGAAATAQFYFDTNGLVAIIIDRPDVVAEKTDENLVKAHQVVDQLTAEHGQPKTCVEQRKMAALTCTWAFGDAKAIASYRDIGGAAPKLSVAYRKFKDAKLWEPGPVKKLKPR